MSTGNPRGDRSEPDPKQASVLLVDDHEAVRRGLSRYLEIHDFAVSEASTGADALAQLKARGSFSFLLTDLRLPDLEGSEVARAARRICPSLWIALITGWDVDDDEPFLKYFDAVLQKPVNGESLVRRLRALHAERAGGGVSVAG